MGSEFPRSPNLLKGALVVFKQGSVIPSVIAFQYNPETMRRGLEAQHPEAEPGRSAGDTGRVLPPIETFSLMIELDAADQLEAGDTVTSLAGLHPALAELELLLYPSSITMIANQVLALAGSAVIRPLKAPLVLFVYGPSRVVPVRVESLAVTEQAFDPLLNPTLASVDIGLRSLTDAELRDAGPLFTRLGLIRVIDKEVLVAASTASAAAERVRGLLSF